MGKEKDKKFEEGISVLLSQYDLLDLIKEMRSAKSSAIVFLAFKNKQGEFVRAVQKSVNVLSENME